eukprot:6481475-Amphidinium_carterae.2
MHPWYKGFNGSVVASESGDGRYDVIGSWVKKSDTVLEITELPVKKWTQDYKEFLEEMLPKDCYAVCIGAQELVVFSVTLLDLRMARKRRVAVKRFLLTFVNTTPRTQCTLSSLFRQRR